MRNKNRRRIRLLCIALLLTAAADCALSAFLRGTDDANDGAKISGVQKEDKRICQDLVCFPVPVSASSEKLTCSYVDSWMGERTFGGNRHHEGCDIMMDENRRGIYPVVSMTDGVVEKIGWLKLGGYRVGIRSPSGIYYYYAHLESYAETLQEDTKVFAGEFLGFAGDSGYGSEGTTGQFAVHLHVGIYVPDARGKDLAVNPYPYLQDIQDKKLTADFEEPGKDPNE